MRTPLHADGRGSGLRPTGVGDACEHRGRSDIHDTLSRVDRCFDGEVDQSGPPGQRDRTRQAEFDADEETGQLFPATGEFARRAGIVALEILAEGGHGRHEAGRGVWVREGAPGHVGGGVVGADDGDAEPVDELTDGRAGVGL